MSATQPAARRGLVFCVSGPSGAGKGTIIRRIMEMKPAMVHSISVTTRPPRPDERDGVDYHFRTKAEFEAMLERGDILEHDCYCGNYYGTPRGPLDDYVSRGIDVLMDITVPGSLSVMRNYPEAITLFLLPPSFTELERRLRQRGTEDQETIRKRLAKAREEIGMTKLFTYAVINDDVEAAAKSVLAIAEAEHCRYERLTGLEDNILAQ